MNDKITSSTLWEQAWHLILTHAGQANLAFGTAAVASVGHNGLPRNRTIVLRAADRQAATLTHYTDRRSVKVHELRTNPVLSYLFWDAESQIQFSAHGPTHWLPQNQAHRLFEQLPKHSRKAYATTSAPSSPLPAPGTGLPDDWDIRTLAETDYAQANFGVLVTRLVYADVLLLDRSGNRRLSAIRSEKDRWTLNWIVP